MSELDRTCAGCGSVKPLVKFLLIRGRYRSRTCSACITKRCKRDPAKRAAKARRYREQNVAGTICQDSRRSDRREGRSHDLTPAYVAVLIADGCSYCGNRLLRMTVDRLDNTKGHTKDNVVAACIRCNYLRRDMPLEAWTALTPAVRDAVEQGLFGSWTGAVVRR